MWVQWSEQREYMDISWGCGWFLATMFVVVNLIGQLGAVAMVLTRYKVDIACGVLFFIVVLQVHYRDMLIYSSSIGKSLKLPREYRQLLFIYNEKTLRRYIE